MMNLFNVIEQRVTDLFSPENRDPTILIGKTIIGANIFVEQNPVYYYNNTRRIEYVCDKGYKDVRDERLRVKTHDGVIIQILHMG